MLTLQHGASSRRGRRRRRRRRRRRVADLKPQMLHDAVLV
jgi:hypothetical protein